MSAETVQRLLSLLDAVFVPPAAVPPDPELGETEVWYCCQTCGGAGATEADITHEDHCPTPDVLRAFEEIDADDWPSDVATVAWLLWQSENDQRSESVRFQLEQLAKSLAHRFATGEIERAARAGALDAYRARAEAMLARRDGGK